MTTPHGTVRRSSRFGLAHVRNTKRTDFASSKTKSKQTHVLTRPFECAREGNGAAFGRPLQSTECAHVAVVYKAVLREHFNQIRGIKGLQRLEEGIPVRGAVEPVFPLSVELLFRASGSLAAADERRNSPPFPTTARRCFSGSEKRARQDSNLRPPA
jgi:hypothetical protein